MRAIAKMSGWPELGLAQRGRLSSGAYHSCWHRLDMLSSGKPLFSGLGYIVCSATHQSTQGKFFNTQHC